MKSKLMKNKSYLTLMGAQAISSIGDWLSIVAIITLVGLKWNASPFEVSLIILCLALPMAFLGPVAGIVADRFNRKMLMITSDVVRAGLILILTVANTIWIVYICLFTIGIFSSIFIPAKNGKLKELVKDEDMKSAMSITSMIDSSTKVLGPLLSGLLVTAFGAKIVFLLDSATFIVSAILIAFLPKTVKLIKDNDIEEDHKADNSFKRELIEGFSFIKSKTYMLVGLTILGLSLLILQLSDSQIIVLIRELSEASPDLFGYIVTAAGLGMFFAGLLLANKPNYNTFILIFAGVFGIGFSFGMMGVLTNFDLNYSAIWAPLLGFSGGFSASLIFIPFQATVQIDTPVHMTGRVFGVINSVTTTATIIGPLLGGWLATVIGIIPTFVITASLLIIVAIAGLLTRSKFEEEMNDVSESKQGAPETATS
ncbi:MFS family permease [Salirhabdus euzebyi]|uniref:MFS family permease n=1 Tax=Salirhabdus euzebyi TaxID=394506 RepID=A0A841Q8W5_9BACI|nr:MFS transporter [Salirhabdus euzebyi]MBB6454825.1 MFS family permease [Salirhabdus euzebyi]